MNILSSAFVPEDSMDIIQARVARIAKRAIKKGFPAPVLRIGASEDRPIFDPETNKPIEGQFTKWIEAIIEGEPIKFSGWELIGVVSFVEDADGDAKPVVDRVPGVEGDLGIVTQYDYCGYCQTTRRRNETFLVRTVSPVFGAVEYNQVGRNCLRDFLGHSPEALLAMYEAYSSLSFDEDEIGGWAGSATKFYPPEYVLDIAARIVAVEGFYISKARAEEDDRTSTAELVREYMSAPLKYLDKWLAKYPKDDESDKIVQLTLDAIPALDPYNEYESKIIDLVTAKGIQWRHVGTLASAVIQGLRAMDRKSQGKGQSEWIGQVGERITVPVKVTMKRHMDDAFGRFERYLIRMTSGDNDLLTFASWTATVGEIKEGEEFIITTTVKGHESDRYTKRQTTVVTRTKWIKPDVSEREGMG